MTSTSAKYETVAPITCYRCCNTTAFQVRIDSFTGVRAEERSATYLDIVYNFIPDRRLLSRRNALTLLSLKRQSLHHRRPLLHVRDAQIRHPAIFRIPEVELMVTDQDQVALFRTGVL